MLQRNLGEMMLDFGASPKVSYSCVSQTSYNREKVRKNSQTRGGEFMPKAKRQARRAKRQVRRVARRAARVSRRTGRRVARAERRAGRRAARQERRTARKTARGARRAGRRIGALKGAIIRRAAAFEAGAESGEES
jgi:hypothetical protein